MNPRHIMRSFAVFLSIFVGLASAAVAQDAPDEGASPAGLAPGAPAGSYALSDLERINLFSGGLSLRVPLLTVGGRGDVALNVGVTIEQHWGVKYTRGGEENPPQALPRFNWWRGIRPGYGPGTLRVYRDYVDGQFLTRMTFTASDETQYELIDEGRLGPLPWGVQRGQVFKTFDGTSVTFRSNDMIVESDALSTGNGELWFPDGTLYRIDNGLVSFIRDRHGNVTKFSYMTPPDFHAQPIGQQVSQIIDPLNRVISFTYASTAPYVPYDTITFKGFGGIDRTIWVHYSDLSQALDAGLSISTLGGLFPELLWANPTSPHNPKVVSSIQLPNGLGYGFLYNDFAELVQVSLPTGGAYRYSYGPGLASGPASGALDGTYIYRRLRGRETFGADGGKLSSMSYGPEQAVPMTDQYVQELASSSRAHMDADAGAGLGRVAGRCPREQPCDHQYHHDHRRFDRLEAKLRV